MEMPQEGIQLTDNPETQVISREIARLGEYITPVTTIPAKVTLDEESSSYLFTAELPVSSGRPDFFARIVSKDQRQGHKIFFRTGSSGRADYFAPVIFKVKNGGHKIMSAIMTKGSGSLVAIEKTGSPFAARSGGEIEGSATIVDCRLDAKNSQKLYEARIRTRVALGVWLLDEINYEGRVYKAQELINLGLVIKQEDLPAIGVFASKTALKLEDIRYILASCPLESPEIGTLITYLIRTTAYDEDPEFKIFSFKYKDSVGTRINEVSVEKRREILNDYSLALARILGQSAGRFEKKSH